MPSNLKASPLPTTPSVPSLGVRSLRLDKGEEKDPYQGHHTTEWSLSGKSGKKDRGPFLFSPAREIVGRPLAMPSLGEGHMEASQAGEQGAVCRAILC